MLRMVRGHPHCIDLLGVMQPTGQRVSRIFLVFEYMSSNLYHLTEGTKQQGLTHPIPDRTPHC